MNNTLKMMAMFQREFSCRSIVFTTSEPMLRLCRALGLTATYDIEENPYGLPYIGSMFRRAASLFQAQFYGYINADILLSTKIFSILSFIQEQRKTFFPDRMVGCLLADRPQIELCHNSYITTIPDFPASISAAAYEQSIGKLMSHNYGQRGPSSVVGFSVSPLGVGCFHTDARVSEPLV